MKKLIFLTIIFISLAGIAREYTFERITSKDGLSQNNVLSIYQCSDGYMWFATYDGLNRYDGYDFKVYRSSTEDSNSISSNLLSCITEDSQKNLWISSFNNGICRFDKDTEKFTVFDSIPGVIEAFTGNEIYNLFCDSKDNIWLSTVNGLFYLEMKNGNIVKGEKFIHTENPNSLALSLCNTVYEDSKGEIFVANRGGLDMMRKGENGEVQNSFYHLLSSNDYRDIRQIEEIGEGYLVSYSLGILLMKFNSNDPENVEITPLEEHFCHYFIIDPKGNIWSSGDNGVYRLERTNDNKMPFKVAEHFIEGETEEFLSNKVIRCLTIDKAGIIWMGTNGRGIMKCNTMKARFRHYNKTKQKGSLTANQVWSIFEDPMHNLWFSTEGGGLNLLPVYKNKDYKTGFTAYAVNPANEQNFAFQVIDISKSHIPTYLVGVGYENKIVKVEQHQNIWKVSNALPEIIWQVMALCKDEYGAAWLGTYGDGLYRYVEEGKTYSLSHFTPNNSTLPTPIIRSVFEDSKGRLWIGTDAGLVILPRNEKKNEQPNFVVIKSIPGDSTSLSHNYIVPVMETKNGEIWIGTFGGALNKYIEGSTETNGTFHRLGIEDGLPNNTIKQIIEDDLGNLWVSSNNGLSRVDSSRTKIRNFDLSDGLQDLEFTDLSGTKLSDGEIIFGGVNGFNAFYPHEIYEDTTRPTLVFTDLEIKNAKVEINIPIDGELILEKVINKTEVITLKHFHNSFTIFFSALHYDVPKGNMYKYKLDGYDDSWITTTYQSRFAHYTNMEAGTYTFKLLASNSSGIWVKEPRIIKIIVKPPFWKTLWFIALVTLLIIFIILLVFYWRTQQMRLRNIILKREVELRTQEITRKNFTLLKQSEELNESNVVLEERQQQIEEQAEELRAQKDELLSQRDNLYEVNNLLKERQTQVEEQAEELTVQRDELYKANAVKDKLFSIVAHDLKNPFNSLSGFLEILHLKFDKYNEEKKKTMLGHALSSVNSIQTLLMNLLSWARSQTGAIQFNPNEANIVEVLESNIKLVRGQAEEKNIKVKLNASNPFIILSFDSDLMNTVIRNLLTNALKFTPEEGNIIVECTDSANQVTISIKDSGIGISEENQLKLFKQDVHFTTHGTNNETGTGLGLITCKDFIEKHEGTIAVESEEGKGTTFTIVIPKS